MLAFCTQCWAEIQAEAKACPACGAVLDQDPRSFQEKLVGALRHPLPATRVRICWLLGEQVGEWAVSHLVPMLKDRDAFVRASAVTALGKIGGAAAREAVRQAASDNALVVRQAAGAALAALEERRPA